MREAVGRQKTQSPGHIRDTIARVNEIRRETWREAVDACRLLTSPVYHLLRRWHDGWEDTDWAIRLDGATVEWDPRVALGVVLAAGGYPGSYEKGKVISGLDRFDGVEDAKVFHAGTALKDGVVLTAGGRVAVVDETKCTGCLTCVRICPFGVPQVKPNLTGVGNIMGAAVIEAAVCQGCGTCVSECPARAIQLLHYTDAQMAAKVDALMHPPSGFVPLADVVEVS